MTDDVNHPSRAGFGSCPLNLWLARQCGAYSPAELPGKLEAAQTALLRSTLRQALCGAFYARHLRECDLDITSMDHLERLPFTTAEDLRHWGDFLCVSQGDVQRMVTLHTSGTTGQPKRLAFTDADLARTRDFFAVGMSQLVGAGQRLAVLLPGAERPDGVADLLRQALSAACVDVLAPPPEVHAVPAADTDSCAEPGKALALWLEQAKPHCLVAAPAQLALLLKHFPHRGPQGLEGILTSAEPLDDALGQALRRAWQCEILDHYGLTETAYGCAVECPAHQGFHVRELDVLIEIVDISGRKVLAPGEEGEVVITTLQRQAMPLVRYRTCDVACLLPAPCTCGSPLRRLGPVRGRIERKNGQPPRIVRPAKGRGL